MGSKTRAGPALATDGAASNAPTIKPRPARLIILICSLTLVSATSARTAAAPAASALIQVAAGPWLPSPHPIRALGLSVRRAALYSIEIRLFRDLGVESSVTASIRNCEIADFGCGPTTQFSAPNA